MYAEETNLEVLGSKKQTKFQVQCRQITGRAHLRISTSASGSGVNTKFTGVAHSLKTEFKLEKKIIIFAISVDHRAYCLVSRFTKMETLDCGVEL